MIAPTAAELARLERFAELEGDLAEIEELRSSRIAEINAYSDAVAAPLRAEQAKLTAAIETWFAKRGAAMVPAGRKSVVIGGCEVGTRSGRATLAIQGDEQAVVDALGLLRWGKPFLRHKVTLERAAVLKELDGSRGPALAELGFSRAEGTETFFVRRAVQEGLPK